jgi:hypothetical protein
VITTTQALDHATGAGMLGLDAAYRLYVGDPSGITIGDTLTAALTWFANRAVGSTLESATDVSLGNLSLQVWWADDTGSQSLVAQSIAPYGTTEFLRFTAPLSGTYGLRVLGLEPVYDLDPTPTASTSCGLAWQTLAVPEPSTLILMAIAAAVPAAGIVREACGRRRTDLRRVVD